ncbi:MAG: septum formation protein Maf [Candidatus Riflebacteria bacterium]|nr:septum formation protein Maf [Candidatus Riflebacteria bacterium]
MPAHSARKLPPLFLASQSPRRREILDEIGIPFSVISSPYQEKISDVEDLLPTEQASKLAALKAYHAAKAVSGGIVIGADTIVVLDKHILGKPRDREDARRMLELLAGKPHKVITGVALVNTIDLSTVTHSEVTRVFFRGLSAREIDRYLDTPEPYDKAGAYAIQGLAGLFVERIDGCYYNVVGFPLVAFSRLMKEAGYDLFDYVGKKLS